MRPLNLNIIRLSFTNKSQKLKIKLFFNVLQNLFKIKKAKNSFFFGKGLEPESLKSTTKAQFLAKATTKKSIKTNYDDQNDDPQLIIMQMMHYSKPRLPPRLNWKHFDVISSTTTTTTTTKTNKSKQNLTFLLLNSSNDANLTHFVSHSLNLTRQNQDKLNKSLNKTLYEVTLNLYENEHVQMLIKRLFNLTTNSLGIWPFILNKLKCLLFMCVDVLVIGMRYYPLMGVMERRKSCLCMMLASFYMWLDVVYNVLLTGLCEGRIFFFF